MTDYGAISLALICTLFVSLSRSLSHVQEEIPQKMAAAAEAAAAKARAAAEAAAAFAKAEAEALAAIAQHVSAPRPLVLKYLS